MDSSSDSDSPTDEDVAGLLPPGRWKPLGQVCAVAEAICARPLLGPALIGAEAFLLVPRDPA